MTVSIFCISPETPEVLNNTDLDSGETMMFPHIDNAIPPRLTAPFSLVNGLSQSAVPYGANHAVTASKQPDISQDSHFLPLSSCHQDSPDLTHSEAEQISAAQHFASKFPQKIWIEGDRSFENSDPSLAEQALHHYQQGYLTEALEGFEAQLLEQQRQCDLMGMGETLLHIGRITSELGGEAKSAIALHQALELATASQALQLQSRSLYELGHAARNAGLPLRAIQYFKQSAGLFAEINDDQSAGYALTEMGRLYGGLGRDDRMQQLCAIAADILREANDLAGEATALYHCGIAAYRRENYSEAIARLEQASTIHLATGNTSAEANSRTWLGHAYRNQDMTRCAMCCYWDAWKLCAEAGDRQGTLTNLVELGSVYEREDMLLSALDAYHQAIELLHDLYSGASLDASLLNHAKHFELTGAIEEAVNSYRQLIFSCKPFDSNPFDSDPPDPDGP